MPIQGQPPPGIQQGAPIQQQQLPMQQTQQQAPQQQPQSQSQPQTAPAKPVWTEHVDKNSGRTYYYNTVTKQSAWTKPADYVPPEGAASASSAPSGTPAAQTQTQQPAATVKSSSGWKEYSSPDGRKYYHNASTGVTQWNKPADFEAPGDASKPAAENVNGKAEDKASSGVADSAKPQEEDGKEKEEVEKKRKQTAKERERERQLEAEREKERMREFEKQLAEVKYDSKEEALAAFKAMLEDKVTSHTMTWQELVPLCQYDVRFRALKSTGEKKNVFQHFITQKQKDFIDKERIRKKEAKEAFIQLLEESEFIDHKARLRDVTKELSKDPRFKAVESERERSELFEDYVMKLEKKEKERLKSARTENLKAFVELLEQTPDLTSKSRWSEVKALIKDDERYLALEGDDKYRLGAFDDYMQTLARKEAEEKELARERRRQAEKAQRAALQELLTELNAKNIVTAKTAWKDIEEDPAFMEDSRTQTMLAEQSKGKVMDAFDDYVEELNRKFLADRPALKDAYKAATALDVLQCGPKGFEDAIREHRDAHDISEQHIELFYKELLKLAQEEEAKKERRKQRNNKEFCRLIRKYIERGKLEENATYEQASDACKDRSAWKDISSSERPALFEKAMEEAKAAAKDDDRRSRSRSRSKSPKKRRDRSSSRSRSEAKKPKRDTEDGEIEEGEA
jgi:pre-mRNA-processing factor 40